MGIKPVEELVVERDCLLQELYGVYSGAPSTNNKAYRKAQEALKSLEDMTFSDEEIDAFLPRELKKVARREGAPDHNARMDTVTREVDRMDPWYRVVTPRKEVREGRSFSPDEFAIALEQVVAGAAPEDYRDPAFSSSLAPASPGPSRSTPAWCSGASRARPRTRLRS